MTHKKITAIFDPRYAYPNVKYPSAAFEKPIPDRASRRRSKTWNGIALRSKNRRLHQMKADIQTYLLATLREQGITQ